MTAQCRGHCRVCHSVTASNPLQGSASGVKRGSFPHLLVCEALATDSNALAAEHISDACLGYAVVGADLLGRFAGLVAERDVCVVAEGQESLSLQELIVLIQWV